MSHPYPNKNQIKTWSRFWEERFDVGLVRDMDLSDGICLKMAGDGSRQMVVCYKEDAGGITMDLSQMKGKFKTVAVDTKKAYKEIEVVGLEARRGQMFKGAYVSDWAVVVFDRR